VVRRETLLLNLQIVALVVAGFAFWIATWASGRAPTAESLAWLAVGLAAANFVLCGATAFLCRGAARQ
jgi:hypothetical protein